MNLPSFGFYSGRYIQSFYHLHMTNTNKSRVIQQIDEVLIRASWGLPMSRIEYYYQRRHHKPLDYKHFGVSNIHDLFYKLGREEKVLLLEKPESEEPFVMSVRLAEEKQKGYLKFLVKELLDKHGGEIPFSSFEDFYKDHSKLKWNSYHFGLTDLDQLCVVLKDIVTVEVESSGKVMKTVNRDSWEIEEKKALLLKKRESKTTYVLSVAEEKQKGYLKFIVKELLDKYGGEIAFFEDFYKDKFKVEWKSHYFGLTDLDQICDVLKDIMMVEVNSSGKKVMKAVNKDSKEREMNEKIRRLPDI